MVTKKVLVGMEQGEYDLIRQAADKEQRKKSAFIRVAAVEKAKQVLGVETSVGGGMNETA